jgi:aminoglycoside 6-adenylyltransferase
MKKDSMPERASRADRINVRMLDLEERFINWAVTNPDIRAAIVVGSRARTDHPADEWADLDILVFAVNPERYVKDTNWLGSIGQVWASHLELTVGGDPECVALFEGGLRVDFVLTDVKNLQRLSSEEELPDIIRRGTRIILDKDSTVARLRPLPTNLLLAKPPSLEQFLGTVNGFWQGALYGATQLRRGELWIAKQSEAREMGTVLRMLEWHARAVNGWDYDTWYGGHFLNEWADRRAVAQLRDAFGHFDEEDSWRVLLATMELFHWLARETANHLGYDYPEILDTNVSELITKLHSEA